MKHISKYLHSTFHEATPVQASDTKQEITITVHCKKERQARYITKY